MSNLTGWLNFIPSDNRVRGQSNNSCRFGAGTKWRDVTLTPNSNTELYTELSDTELSDTELSKGGIMSTKLFFISCSLLLSIITSPAFAAFSLGNYNHLSGVAYFFEKERGVHDRQPKIVKVDFANQTREVIRDDGYQ